MRNATLGAMLSLCIIVGPACLGSGDGDLQDGTGTAREALWTFNPIVCGNGTCDPGETRSICPWDCDPPMPSAYCGDGLCDGFDGEDTESCPSDCPSECGDGECNGGENLDSCEEDCASCGDTVCNGDEDGETCPEDCCLASPRCGDGFCRFEVCHASSCLPGQCCNVCVADCCEGDDDDGGFDDDGDVIEPSCNYNDDCEVGEFADCPDCEGVVVDPGKGGPAQPEWPGQPGD